MLSYNEAGVYSWIIENIVCGLIGTHQPDVGPRTIDPIPPVLGAAPHASIIDLFYLKLEKWWNPGVFTARIL